MVSKLKKSLDPRKSIFISEILSGKSGAEAARAAGVEKKNSSRQAHRWQKEPEVAAEIEKGLAAIREGAEVTCETMIRQLDADRLFAIKTANASAATRASELKAKLVGLMVDRHDSRSAHFVKSDESKLHKQDLMAKIDSMHENLKQPILLEELAAPDKDSIQ